ncbi:MAG: class I SAM-dependent methyltransferase [Alphaproteobacteria bacterium]|nr:class I SAM-dependent methyltransferase [Alphaproteobacteria bacterium]
MAVGAEDFEFVRDTGLIERLQRDGGLIASETVATDVLGDASADARYVVEHPRLPFVSHPYEWPFSALKAAALHHLNIHLAALAEGVTLSDASAYNIQFLGVQPLFIDLLSFRRYRDGEMWSGHRQFCEQFLNPLLLRSKLGVAHNAWYRGTQEGISAGDLRRLLPWTKKMSRNVLLHVIAQAAFQKSAVPSGKSSLATEFRFPLQKYQQLLSNMRRWIERLEPADTGKTVWQDYAGTHSYSADEFAVKTDFVARFCAATKPKVIWDLGCNIGDFSKVALENGAELSCAFDFDQGALEAAFARASSERLMMQPLLLDAANPSPNQGWNECERKGLRERANADGMLALAFIHHLAIGRNIPLADLIDWLVGLAPQGIIEFVPKADPKVQELLALREDIFPQYTEECFRQFLSSRADIVEVVTVTETGRKLFWFRART